jgi:2-dehydropantoate 2-reductase
MKIVIVGPGAIGILLATFLCKSKEEVWLLDYKKERAEKLKNKGILLECASSNIESKPRVTSDPKEIGTADLVIICVKSYDTKNAGLQCKSITSDKTSILTLQNGIGNIELLAETLDSDKIIAGVTNLGATLIDTGRARFAGKGETIIGKLDAKASVEMRTIRELFNKVGLETKISHDIKAIIWSKLIINVGINALSAITRLNNGKLIKFEGTRKIMRQAVTEAVRVTKRKRIKLIYDDPLAKVESVCEATAENQSSMLQDILRKKQTEIDFINGVILRLGQEQNIPVPVNSLLIDLVKTIEASSNPG